MRKVVEPRKSIHAKALAILVIAALVAAVVGCETPVTRYSLTITSTVGGEVTVPGEGRSYYSIGRMVNLVAVADEGHRFTEWTGDVSTIDDMKAATTRIAMDDDYSITANFVTVYDLSISSTGGGSVTTPGEGTFTYDQGAVVSLMATRATGYRFVGWAGDVNTVADVDAAATTITMNGDYTITARFEEKVPVVFVCPNLEAMIRQALGITVRPLYPSDLERPTFLRAGGWNISDVNGLEHCVSLTSLDLSNNQIRDISSLAALTSLTDLDLSCNKVGDISPLAGLTNLSSLDLGWNQIDDISLVPGFTNLTTLGVAGSQIDDISLLEGLTSLTDLDLRSNQITDLSPLAGLRDLRRLRLGSNLLRGISPLADLKNLTSLYLEENQISDVSPLEGLTGLLSLCIDDNQIRDLSPLVGLTNLTRLYLSSNQIGDISPLEGLTSLRTIVLSDNQITDISPLVDNVGLGEGDYVNLRENPLSEQSINKHIPALRARGVTVRC